MAFEGFFLRISVRGIILSMGDMADLALEELYAEDDAQLEALGTSIVFWQQNKYPTVCPACGAVMIAREGPYGRFMGCSAFPKCKSGPTIALKDEPVLSVDDEHEMDRL